MRKREIKRIKRAIRSGKRAFVLRNITLSKERVRADLQSLCAELRELLEQYVAQRAAWRTEDVLPPGARPVADSEQMRKARLARAGAWLTSGLEIVLAGYVTNWAAAPMLIAALLPWLFKAGLLSLWQNDAQPPEALRKLNAYVLAPALLLLCGALPLLLLARLAPQETLASWQTLFVAALLLLALGLLLLAIGLFARAHLLSWSQELARRFRARHDEFLQTRELLHYLLVREAALQHQPPAEATFPPALPRVAALLPGLLWLVLAAGCSATPSAALEATAVSHAAVAVSEPASELRLIFDYSDSQDSASYAATLAALGRQLPSLCADFHVQRLLCYGFGPNGWEAQLFFACDLPARPAPPPPRRPARELELWRGQFDPQAETQRQQKELRQQEEQYRAALATALTDAPAKLRAGAELKKTAATDLNGVLARIVRFPAQERRQLVLLVTDGEQFPTDRLAPQPPPPGVLALGVLLTTGRRCTAAACFAQRQAQFTQALPWAAVAPYHDETYHRLLREALKAAPRPARVVGATGVADH